MNQAPAPYRLIPALAAVLLFSAALPPDGQIRSSDLSELRQALFEAEDSRVPDDASLNILLKALSHSEADIRRTAVRALGRLVRPALYENIALLLSDPDPAVRSEAANALAQCLSDVKPYAPAGEASAGSAASVGKVFSLLETRLKIEPAAEVRGVILRTIGRLAYPDEAGFRLAEKVLCAAGDIGPGAEPARRGEIYGAVKGIESLLRRKARVIKADESCLARLGALLKPVLPAGGDPSAIEEAARIRRLAMMSLTWAGRLDGPTLEAAAADPDGQVRRLVFFGWGRVGLNTISGETADRLLIRGLTDPSELVRYEALRIYGRVKPDQDPLTVLKAVGDASPHVVLLALDLLGQLKAAPDSIIVRLDEIAAGRPTSAGRLAAAHAFVSLAKIAPARARNILPRFLTAQEWVVRTYAASAAAVMGDAASLEKLLADSHDNVRNEALSGLIKLRGRAADPACLAALERNDYQLILTAVGGMKGSPANERTVQTLFAALTRLTAQKRETSRDPRLALLERIGEMGTKARAGELESYTEDFDPQVASAAADIVARWTGRRPDVHPRKTPVLYPWVAEIDKLRSATVRVTMAWGGSFEMKLFVDESPATIGRFIMLARNGYYDGLTIHRIVPNFLVQGGSPGANEFTGDALFMRDESGLESNVRGTVGISTRGRDTGDAQIYINTVDNDRLDHEYCVFARVTFGMDVVDRILEGDVIKRIEVLRSTGS